jgi:hypothetical protein
MTMDYKKLPIRPFKIPGKIVKVPLSKIKSGKNQEKSISISDAIVVYIDILGFSEKKDGEDIEMCLLDFSGPLTLAAHHFPQVRFNVFSDCAFIASNKENAKDLLSAIRYSFSQWISDGILVRGGIAIGSYNETQSSAQCIAPKNYVGSLFSGSAVTGAVKLEGSGKGALLFTNEECAELYYKNYGEPIFKIDDSILIGWSDEDSILYWFTGISFLRLINLFTIKKNNKSIIDKLLNNIIYAFDVTDSLLPRFLVLAILSSSIISPEVREKVINILKVKDPDDFIPFKDMINEWLNDSKELKYL